MKKAKETVEAPVTTVEAKVKGRPANPKSKRQLIIAARAAAIEAGTFRKGRPSVAGSKRQAILAARAAKIASGEVIKRGRPKTKVQEVVVAPIKKVVAKKVVAKKAAKK